MNLTTKNFETSFELTEYLKSVLAGYKEISLRCFMATDETYWEANLLEDGYSNLDVIETMKKCIGKTSYSDDEFINLLSFINKIPFFESTAVQEFYELEIYTKENIYFVNPALKKILIKKKNFLHKMFGFCGDITSLFWKYEFVNSHWEIISV
ncbi:hypothetical protein [Treponema sp.]|uniref:hypothetical protein n=1 Tax=Treponema sp. TaxID=166 RepID=UPI00298DA2EC|nr:hypothetical protein [Treponema sp.]MCR5612403.1 hypothetical protein [Treponema sp.]